ncbi:acetate/butyrate--CoA ligase AAE7, peroxisomal-like [Quercus lobata]|uniref:acetate/butyrate--CoA ligase AAE7, peroxisomal-like n=1 Tax=Quercus lobata TaxID=97700 RepID=UPI0012463748|nr:acetate/butyrate--CoA ligase AAE7, peroxisomal-like [Quercus lobata]
MGQDIDDLPKNAANFTALTLLWFLDRAALVHPNKTSLLHGSLRYTWRDTYNRCRRLASSLSKHSIGLSSTCFTMDEKSSRAVTEAFVRLHEKKLIYKL